MMKILDIFKTSKKRETDIENKQENTDYSKLNTFLNDIDHSEMNYVEQGHSNLTSDDEQCTILNNCNK